jgi:hypothetical protein
MEFVVALAWFEAAVPAISPLNAGSPICIR